MIEGIPRKMLDRRWVQNLIDRSPRGYYSAKELFGEHWGKFRRQRYYGKVFKQMILSGKLSGIRVNKQRTNKSWEYEVFDDKLSL